MLLFSRILDFKQKQILEVERRREQRYIPGKPFPLYATIEVDGEPRNVKIIDLSPNGVGLHVAGPTYAVGLSAILHLMLDEVWMKFPCRIAHIRSLAVGSRLGLVAEFENFAAQKAYLQLLQPVAIGSVFRTVPPEEVRQNDPDLYRQAFTGRSDTELNIWRQTGETGTLLGFLWRFDDYMVRGDMKNEGLQIYSRNQLVRRSRSKKAPVLGKLPIVVKREIQQLFRWSMMNLSKDIPADIRTFLQSFSA